ncbi:MarR family winged helix-turn-helix transcriptional regulator [Microbacterium sp. NPDC057961]
MVRLRARLRAESAPENRSWSWPQVSTLNRLVTEGPQSVSALATAEHVRPQSMAETVAGLKEQGFVSGRKDPADGRRVLYSATDTGRELVSRIPEERESWLEGAISTSLSATERRTIAAAVAIMERLAEQ